MTSRLLVSLLACSTFIASAWSYSFSVSSLQGVALNGATSLQFGPDQRLYVAQVNGQIKAFTVQRVSANNYQATATELINLVRDIPNYDDSGTRNFALSTRQVTGLLVAGTAANPVLYVTSSDPRIGGGSGGENDLNLDTNSGVLSKLTRSGTTWSKVDLVRGLPRSEENHASNGMQLEPITNTLYLAQGGNTNAGGPSINFAYAAETALSSSILSIDLNAITALPLKTDPYGHKYYYDLPTVDDPNPDRGRNADGSNANDPFGGNDGLNQARLVPGGPVQIYSPGFRNPYDLVLTRATGREGRMYTFDNAANQGWGGYPKNEGPTGNVTNEYVEGEAGTVNNLDNLHFITGRGYYGGHPNPIRANPAGAGWFHFDNTQPTGSQKIFSLNPTTDWPSVPLSLANPVEGDFLQPGAANGALLTNSASTNGLAEYISNHFSGEMLGNLIAASYDGKLLRIALSPDGTAVTNARETLASGFGALPLDVTTPDPGSGTAFVGTIWVAHYSPAKISVLEPADFDSPGTSTCTGLNSFDVDEDGDGYSNADEIANNADPCSGAVRPPDADADFVSDLLDQDDDNDGIDDTQDPFPLDAQNGQSQPMPIRYELFNDAGFGFYGVGLTGVMINRGEDYLQLLSQDNIIGGGTAGLFTVAQAGPGLALGSSRSQKDAYQFAINSDEFTTPYVVSGRLSGPFFANAPTAAQRQGIYVGTGDQDNFVWIALHANGGSGGFEVVYELGGTVVTQVMYPFSGIASNSTIDFSFAIDPAAGTMQPGYQLSGATAVVPLGSAINVTGAVLQSVMGTQPLAAGLFATTSSGTTPAFSATVDYFDVTPVIATSRAKVIIDPTGTNMATSSTYSSGAFKIENLSTGGQHIQSVTIDLSTAMIPDFVYDPTGTAGDVVAKNFQANSASAGVSLASGVATHPHNGVSSADGYDQVDVTFNSFPVNGTFTFSIDIDPTSVKGVAQPGQNDSASVSGLELIGSTATVYFNDGTVHRTKLARIEGSVDGSYGWLRSDRPSKPGLSFLNKASPLKSGQAQETVRVSGPAGLTATVLVVESALYIGGVPGGGYDLDPFESNTAIKITEVSGVIPATGFRDFVITPTKTNTDAGFNVITAVLSDASGLKGSVSDELTLWYDPTFSGGDAEAPTAPDSLTAPGITSRSVTLSWSASTDNVGVRIYEVLRDGAIVATTLGLNYTDVGLEAGTSYSYSIIARDEANNASPAATLTVPTPANGTVVLRINGGGPAFVDTKGNTWAADSGFNTGTVTTSTNAIDRALDDTLFKTDRIDSATALPDLAYAFTLANGDYEVQLFFAELSTTSSAVGKRVFDVVVENQLAFDNLDVFALAGAPYTAVVVSTTTSVTDGQLNLAFVRGIGNPKVNAIKVIRLPAAETVPPSTPANFKSTATTATSVTLAWDAATDNVGVTGYLVTRNGTSLPVTENLSITDTGLTASTTYTYTVRAQDEAGNISTAASLTATTENATADTQPPTSPGALTFSAVTASSITVNWTAATDNVAVTGYRVSRAATVLATIAGLNFIDTGLTSGTAYSYTVVALDEAGNVSPASTGTVSTLSSSPTGTTIRVNAGGASLVDSTGITWAADTGFNTGTIATTSRTVTGTTAPTLFKSERYQQPTDPLLVYTFPVTNGNYLVRLHFAETNTSLWAAGKRVFNIDVQSTRAFSNVDIFVMAGGADKALVLEKAVSVTTGQVLIGFGRLVENPKINAIEILPQSAPADSVAPSSPGSPTFSGVTASTVTLDWTAATDNVGVTGYRITRNDTEITTVLGLTYTDTALAASTSYTYAVTALDAAGNVSAASSATVATTAGADTQPPTAPGPLTFSAITSSSVSVSWTAATDNIGVTGYRISREGTVLTTVTGLTYADTSLAPSTTYAYAVEALDAAGNVSPVSGASTTTLATADTQPPSSPGSVTFSAISATGLTINWTSATDNVGVTGYRISRNGTLVTTVPGLSYADTGLAAGTSYSYAVVAIDAAGNNSTASSGTTSTTSDGGTGTTVRINAGGASLVDSVGLTWVADKGFNTGRSTSNTHIVTGTTAPAVFKTERYQQPADPQLVYTLIVPNGDYLVRLHFAETYLPTSAPGKRKFNIDLQSVRAFSNVDIFVLAGGADKALVLAQAVSVTNGQVKIAFSRLVENPKINAIEIVPKPVDTQAPTSPTDLTSSNLTPTSVTLAWSPATDNTAVTGYRVSRDGALLNTVTTTGFEDTGLSPATGYDYTVVAIDAASNASAPALLTVNTPPVPDTQPPGSPGTLTFSSVTAESVTVQWTAATDNVGVTGYEVSRDGNVVATLPELSFTDSSLAPSTNYAYAVLAIDAAGNRSSASSATVATTAIPDTQVPSPPANLTFTNTTVSGVTVSWTAATDNVAVTGYEVYRDATLLSTVTDLTFTDTGLAAGTTYIYSVVAVDAAENGSAATSASVTTSAATPTTVIRVNSGGKSFVDPAGQSWLADTGFNTGTAATNTVTVAGTTNPNVYKSERYRTPSSSPLSYTFSVPNGNYLVRLHFAETYSLTKAPGKRVFDIDVQSVRAFDNVDIFVLAGGGNRALVLEKTTRVTNGQIKVSFYSQVQNPKINGLEIISVP